MKDAFMFIFAAAIIILLFWWITKIWEDDAYAKNVAKEYKKPENQFKRRKQKFIEILLDFLNTRNYPYVILPTYNIRAKPYEPLPSEQLYLDEKKTIPLKLIKEGKCEKFFYDRLIKRFDKDLIKIGNVYMKGFYPDIAYMDIKNKIFIDIEIDEAYSFKDKTPIHHLETQILATKRVSTLDTNNKRDEAFKSSGWTVVRFSEDQILQNAKECIDLINLIVDYWSEEYLTARQIEYQQICTKRWTTQEASGLATILHRESSIEKKISEYLQKEITLMYDSKYELPYQYRS